MGNLLFTCASYQKKSLCFLSLETPETEQDT